MRTKKSITETMTIDCQFNSEDKICYALYIYEYKKSSGNLIQ